MSFNVKDIYPVVGSLTFDPAQSFTTPSKPSGLQGPVEGTVWNDSIYRGLQGFIAGQSTSFMAVPSVTLVNNKVASGANPGTGAVNLMTYTFPAVSGLSTTGINAPNHLLKLFGAGNITPGTANTPTFTVAVTLGGVTILSWVTTAFTAGTNVVPWNFYAEVGIVTSGATGTVFGHGNLSADITDATTNLMAVFGDGNTAAATSVPLNAACVLQVTGTLSASVATAQFTQDFLSISLA